MIDQDPRCGGRSTRALIALGGGDRGRKIRSHSGCRNPCFTSSLIEPPEAKLG